MSRLSPALLETVRIRNGVAPLWSLHLGRLATSCRALGIPLPGTLLTPEGGADRVCRFEIDQTGVRVSERTVGDIRPVRLVAARAAHAPYPHKTTDRMQFERALEDARLAGADDALFRSEGRGYVAETAIWGVFWWEGRTVCAPPLDLGILPGVARARIAALVGPIAERRVTPDHLTGKALFVANAVRGIVPVAELDGRAVPDEPDTLALARRFWP